MRLSALAIAVIFAAGAYADPVPGTALPNPVKTCADVHAYIGADETMSWETYGRLLAAVEGPDQKVKVFASKETPGKMFMEFARDPKDKLEVVLSSMRILTAQGLANHTKALLFDDVKFSAVAGCSKDGVCTLSQIRVSGC